jgi:phosphate transport system permease protein
MMPEPLAADRRRWRSFKSHLATALFSVCALLTIVPLGLVLFHIVREGVAALNWDFLTKLPRPVGEMGGGMANAILGSVELLAAAAAFGAPIGVLAGIYLSEYGTPRLNGVLRFLADILNGTPSIIWGVVAYGLVVEPFKGFSAYAGSIALGMIMIPLVTRTTEEALLLVPLNYREAALALGIPHRRVITRIVVPTALKGIVTAVLLALARVSGETAPLLFTAFGNRYWNHNFADPIAALPLQIFIYADSPYESWRHQAWAGALVLVCLTLFVNGLVRFLTRGKSH